MAKRHLSLKDLASELNISISTVSRALKNHPDISPELTRKVQELAAVRNYTPNPLAMGLLKQETRMIGVVAFADEYHATFTHRNLLRSCTQPGRSESRQLTSSLKK